MKLKKVALFAVKLTVIFLFTVVILKDIPFAEWRFPKLSLENQIGFLVLTLLFLPHLFWLAYIWKRILRYMGQDIANIEAWKIFSLSSLGRYLPGKIWLFAGKIALAKRKGIKIAETSTSMVLEILGNTLGAALICLLSWLLVGGNTVFSRWSLVALPAILVAFLVIHPGILFPVVNYLLRLVKRPPLQVCFTARAIGFIVVAYAIDWFYQGILYFFLLRLFDVSLSFSQMPDLILINSFSWLVGFFSFLTPGGLGIREGIMIELLNTIGVDKLTAVNLSFAARIWMTIPEFLAGGYFWLFHKSNVSVTN